MKTGIVILNYNDYETTLKCLQPILDYKNIDYIIVVDNCSTNDSYDQLAKHRNDRWVLLRSPSNGGYAKGNNIGINYLLENYNVDVIGIVNPDIYFSDEFAGKIKKLFIKYPDYGIITGVQHDIYGNISKRAFWRELDFGQAIISMFSSFSKIQEMLKGNFVVNTLKDRKSLIEVPTVEGCLFFADAASWIQIHGFDENTFLFMEEDILTKKIHRVHKKIGVCPSIEFTHAHSTSINKAISYFKKMEVMYDSRRYFIKEYISKNIFVNFLFNVFVYLSWVEQIVLVYPYLKLKK